MKTDRKDKKAGIKQKTIQQKAVQQKIIQMEPSTLRRGLAQFILPILFILCTILGGCSIDVGSLSDPSQSYITTEDIPLFSGSAYVKINNNQPEFDDADKTTKSFETYSELDELGRCGVVFANIGKDLMPKEDRGSISQVRPSGWQVAKYSNVDGRYLYNRCHLIGFQLTAENANKKNLITGTRYLNIEGMLPFENEVAEYIRNTNNHVLYRVTPIFEGNDLVASGVQMEGYSVEDDGEGVCFNVFAYNVQPGITIDYATGKSQKSSATTSGSTNSNSNDSFSKQEIRGNSNSKIYHCPGQAGYDEMKDSEYLITFSSEKEAVKAGYRKAKR